MFQHSLIPALLAATVISAGFPGSDPAVRPQDHLFDHANGGWLAKTAIPADKQSYGTFMLLREKSQSAVRELLEQAARDRKATAEAKLIGDFYESILDTTTLDKRGLRPLQDVLTRIDTLAAPELPAEMARLGDEGIRVPVASWVSPDEKAPETYAVYWIQSGLGLPDRDYFLKEGPEAENMREAYRKYLGKLLALAGATDSGSQAQKVYAFELAIAKIQWPRTEMRDALKTYNPIARTDWSAKLGSFGWGAYADGLGMPAKAGAIVMTPSFFKAFSDLAAVTPVETWRAYLRTRTLDAYAEHLSKEFREAYFTFQQKALHGLQAPPPRWRVAVDAADGYVGEAVGQRYVARYFPPEAKKHITVLVGNLRAAYKSSIDKLEWMTPQTRKAAQSKLAKFRVKIGYPDSWRGYKGLVVKRGDAIGNLRAVSQFLSRRDMADVGKKVDRGRWEMTPQTVNAYYNPVGNEIVFPAGILQVPFFDPKGDDAYNYGAIGAVIGHEISHGFDDQGRRYDGDGVLRDWWTSEDEKAFMARADRLVAQYDSYEPLPGQKVNGKLTLGENIADLCGVTMALRAYHLSLNGKAAPVLDGYTGDQRFFLGYARNWRSKDRPEWLKTRLVVDPHAPEQYRTDGVVTHIDAFYQAFGVQEGDKLYRSPSDRVRIW
jgi:predicted metalloendopeptidase